MSFSERDLDAGITIGTDLIKIPAIQNALNTLGVDINLDLGVFDIDQEEFEIGSQLIVSVFDSGFANFGSISIDTNPDTGFDDAGGIFVDFEFDVSAFIFDEILGATVEFDVDFEKSVFDDDVQSDITGTVSLFELDAEVDFELNVLGRQFEIELGTEQEFGRRLTTGEFDFESEFGVEVSVTDTDEEVLFFALGEISVGRDNPRFPGDNDAPDFFAEDSPFEDEFFVELEGEIIFNGSSFSDGTLRFSYLQSETPGTGDTLLVSRADGVVEIADVELPFRTGDLIGEFF
ncbi:MAG: hypothetical protein ACFBRM_02140 [Pikeienuella sp.]